MREIDSQNDSQNRLTRALRSLANASPTDAPAEIGDALAGTFRRHHARRRAVRRSVIAVVLLALVLPATVLLVKKRTRSSAATGTLQRVIVSPPARTTVQPTAVTPVRQAHVKKMHSQRTGNVALAAAMSRANSAVPGDDFLDLPSSENAVRGEELRVVRLELTGRALRMVGAPVAQEISDRLVLADFVVGQDGTPYAVRLVR